VGEKKVFSVKGDNVILAIPPEHATQISGIMSWSGNHWLPGTSRSTPSLSNNTVNIKNFAKNARYDYYIPVILHYPVTKDELGIPEVWGFPKTDWGIISIVISDYTHFDDPRSLTVITSCITLTDEPSSCTGLTANETIDPQELMREVHRQLNEVYKNTLPIPASLSAPIITNGYDKNGIMLISPGVWYDDKRELWVNSDSSFILTPKSGHLPSFENSCIKGLYWVGSLNGQSYYNFTSMESAVSNALSFYLSKFPNANEKYKVLAPVNVSSILRIFILLLLLYLIYRVLQRN
jgi:hypothetical protein